MRYIPQRDKMTYIIRTDKDISITDVDEIFERVGWSGLHGQGKWKSVLERSSFVVHILINNKTVGFGRCVDDTDMCMIYDISVHPDFQKQGIGNLIMTEIMKYIKQQNFVRVQLFADTHNPTLSGFYKKHGFANVNHGMYLT